MPAVKLRKLLVIQLTPPGRGAVATLRIEGPDSVATVQKYFRARSGRSLSAYALNALVVGHFGDEHREEVVVRRCAENAVELHCHGGLAAVGAIEASLLASGACRQSWPDWAAAHARDPIASAALAALANARTERTAAILLDQYDGAFSRAMDDIRRSVNAGLPDEAQQQINAIVMRADLGRHLVEPWQVVLAGRPNVGKSSLINALAGYDRTIVHPTPGTTRDAVTLPTAIDGWPVDLCDTAGLRIGGDAIEQAGIQVARERLEQADAIVLVFDRSAPWSAEDQELVARWPDAILVHNKCDLPPSPADRPAGLEVSAQDGRGLPPLLDAIAQHLVPMPPPPGAAVPFLPDQVEQIRQLKMP